MESQNDNDQEEIRENLSPNPEDGEDGNQTENIEKIDLETIISSEEITVRWPLKQWSVNGLYWVRVERKVPPIGMHFDKKWKYWRAWNESEYSFIAVPGCVHKITVEYVTNHSDEVIASGSVTVTASFNESERKKLMKKAIRFSGTEFTQFEYLYRCKPSHYWRDIRRNEENIMRKYVKDYSGQPADHINGQLEGLFFASKLRDGSLPVASPFGNVRLRVPAQKLISSSTNLFFGDFYCIKDVHYVTIVACVAGSEAEKFCQEKLILLSSHDNPFLKMIHCEGTNTDKFFANESLWVEVFYTEDLSLDGLDLIDFPFSMYNGTSSRHGMPNRKTCSICNIYPRGGMY